MVGIAGYMFGTRPSTMIGLGGTSKGLWIDVNLAPKVLRVLSEGDSALQDILDDKPPAVGKTTQEVKKNTAWMKDPKYRDRILRRTGSG